MRMLVRSVVPVLALAVGAAVVAVPGGCRRSEPPGAATATGSVTFQGQPVTGGLVIFSPDPDRGGSGKPVRGELGPDGRFRLAREGSDAIPPGWYRVAIVALPSGAAGFPPRLARPDLSGIVREVRADRENVFDFAVEVSGP